MTSVCRLVTCEERALHLTWSPHLCMFDQRECVVLILREEPGLAFVLALLWESSFPAFSKLPSQRALVRSYEGYSPINSMELFVAVSVPRG
ncbi:hypothetical protein CgunFtcFv8_025088 [Champsocephalus gunnari]|uniref:Uncharacterized protein n=1 Tax=Champsocephalus gunnari TaxID=52237 RepID=A0AAN8HM01_CHAGU|nr:hypothetical protein CgunFtcFv8_025088 [Champsocephalus gunnari]